MPSEFMDKLPALPAGVGTVAIVSHGTSEDKEDGQIDHVIFLGLGRPLMHETEDGELIATYIMRPHKALELVAAIMRDIDATLLHAEGEEDCSKHL